MLALLNAPPGEQAANIARPILPAPHAPAHPDDQENHMAMKREPPHGPDGLPLDPLAVLREPLYVRAARVRGFGRPESIP